MKQILVPTDFSPNAEKALDYAIQLAKFLRSEVFVLHSVDPGLPESTIADSNEKMELLKKSIASKEMVQVKTEICEGATVNAIVDVSADEKPDLVVMGTLGNSAFKEKVFGSKTAAVIGKADVPVLAIPLLAEWKVPKKILVAIN
ncbi:MAG: universal stress protein, partial [Chitinophagaceae bacterium]|nr:universal stress protein [Chitinophagaceae bacterium]